MSNPPSLRSFVHALYLPVYKLSALVPSFHVLLYVLGTGGLLAALLGGSGKIRWLALLIGLYCWGGAYLMLHAPQGLAEGW